ncbi:MAG TPA: DNA-directed RNA polymerase subunit beta, partial [Fibrobacteres bacterium]|nr:DNA-directed RNA polymerase subunit beta [Fibrobacterota bacterium]
MQERKTYSSSRFNFDLPYLLDVQVNSFNRFIQAGVLPKERKNEGLQKIFKETFPITDVKEQYSLEFEGYTLGVPKYSIEECQKRGMTYAAPLKAALSLNIFEGEGEDRKFKEKITNDVYIGDLPLITRNGTFIINGAERVIVSQLHRSPGVSFDEETHTNGKRILKARVIPYRGSWVEFLIDVNEAMYINIDRRRKIPATILLRAIGFSRNNDIVKLFYRSEELPIGSEDIEERILWEDLVDPSTGELIAEANTVLTPVILKRAQEAGHKKIKVIANLDQNPVLHNTLNADPTSNEEEALFRIYTLIRPGDPPNVATARTLLERLFFDDKRYDLGEVGRYRMNSRLKLEVPMSTMTLTQDDFLSIMRNLSALFENEGFLDDIDHLGNRRVRS